MTGANWWSSVSRMVVLIFRNSGSATPESEYLSPMVLDWPQFWCRHHEYKNISIAECITKMNTEPAFSGYYDNAIRFAAFSKKYQNWPAQIERDGMTDIKDYYDRLKKWYSNADKIG